MTASPRRNGHPLPTLLLAAVLCGTASAQAAADDKPSAAAAPAPPEISPRGERKANDIRYGEWQKLCFRPGGAQTVCRTSITGRYETGQMAVRADLIERDGE